MPLHSLKKKAFIQIVSVFLAQPPPKNLNLFVNDARWHFLGEKADRKNKKEENSQIFWGEKSITF